jgi:hypothetical protein
MQRVIKQQFLLGYLVFFGMLFYSNRAHAQRAQDNWYLEQTWTKTMAVTNGGLSTPNGMAIGPDGRIFVGDTSRIQIYLPDGTFSSAITNTSGGGMITDKAGNLYIGHGNCVDVFNSGGSFVRKIGGITGSGDGQLSGVIDVGVGPSGEIYILENGNSRVSVFGSDGAFRRKWGSAGTLDGQFGNAKSIAVSPDERVYVVERPASIYTAPKLKEFDRIGTWIRTIGTQEWRGNPSGYYFIMGGSSVRLDPSGNQHLVVSYYDVWHRGAPWDDDSPYLRVFSRDGNAQFTYGPTGPGGCEHGSDFSSPCHAIGREGTMILCSTLTKTLWVYRLAFREQWVPPLNRIAIPGVWQIQQRPNSPLVDIDYSVTDADDTIVNTYMMGFTNATQSLATCLRSMTFVEGTETNLGVGVTANQPHRVTWNAGADLNTKLGDFRVAVLAKDSRQKLLDIHYIRLPADRGMPELKISRSPLVPNDFMQVWWWLLATQDTGIQLTGGKIYGSGGAYDSKMLCDATGTTADGRAYIYAKLNVREATSQEVQWAKEGALAGNVNQWSPSGITVAGRPMKVNEYGFDTGSWGSSAWWVVPLY